MFHISRKLAFSLDDLPNELILNIISHMPIKDRVKLRRLNRRWCKLSLFGVTELLVGEREFNSSLIQLPKWNIRLRPVKPKVPPLFLIFLQEESHFLKYLVLDVSKYNFRDSESASYWNKTIVWIPYQCPNIDELCIECPADEVSCLLHLKLIHKFAGQLRTVGFWHSGSFLHGYPDNSRFFIKCLDPTILRCLFIQFNSQTSLDKIIYKFRLLTKFHIFAARKNHLNMKFMPKLVHLIEFGCKSRLNSDDFRVLMNSPFTANLILLNLDLKIMKKENPEEGREDFPFQLLSNLVSLRNLEITTNANRSFFEVLPFFKSLKLFNFRITFRQTDAHLLGSGMRAVSQLQMVKKMSFCLHFKDPIKFNFHSFQPMPSITQMNFQILNLFDGVHEKEDAKSLQSKMYHFIEIFPNLEHLTFEWREISIDCLYKMITRAKKLKSLEIWVKTRRHILFKYCRQNEISVQSFLY